MPPILRNVTRLDSTPVNRTFFTEEGYLRDTPVLTSTGIFEYRNSDGSIRRELRLPEDVFAPESLASYEAKPIIITHDAGLVNKDNVHRFQIGTILTPGMKSGNDVRAEIVIHDTDEMKQSGLKELSLGYNLDLEETSGEWKGMPYDAIQRNIRINHLALVREARAGEQARLNIDSREGTKQKGDASMRKRVIKNTRRADSVLSPEELEKALKMYKEKYANGAKQDADDVEAVNPEEEKIPAEETPEENTDDDEAVVQEEVDNVKENRKARAEAGEPEATEETKALIKDQDDDIGTLIDIIDTLLAERDVNNAKTDADDDPIPEEEEEEVVTDADEEEVLPAEEEEEEVVTDADEEEEIPAEEEEVVTDADEEEEAPEEELTFQKTQKDCKMNADSVDRIVRQRIQIGMLGRKLNMDGLEKMSPMKAKKAIIKKTHPSMRLDGKSATYIDAAFKIVVDDLKNRKGVAYQKKQMFNKDSASVMKRNANSAENARQRMINRARNRKAKEDK